METECTTFISLCRLGLKMRSSTLAKVFRSIDVICVVLFALGIILFASIGKPYRRGFFCNDESIKKPYKDSTISTAMAISVGAVISLAVIILTEIFSNRQSRSNPGPNEMQDNPNSFRSKVPPVIWTIIWVVLVDIYGAAINTFITDVGKYSLGRLRPHFLSVCKPDWSKLSCTDSKGNFLFITSDVCTGTDSRLAKESRLSFPSGHASFSAYVMVFLVLYIEAKLHLPKESKFLKLLIQAIFILLALYTAFSRVSDYKHHWSDVLAGLSIGTIIAFVTVFRVLRPRFGSKVVENPEQQPINNPGPESIMIQNARSYTEEGP